MSAPPRGRASGVTADTKGILLCKCYDYLCKRYANLRKRYDDVRKHYGNVRK